MLSVRSRSPAPFYRGVAQSGSASGLGPEGRRFKSCLPDHFKTKQSGIAQLVEQAAVNRWVVGSSPTAGAIHTNEEKICLWILYIAEHLPAY